MEAPPLHLVPQPSLRWDPYQAWRYLLREYPLRIQDPAGSAGRMDRRHAKLFWISIAEYPDPLQDILFVIAHVRGFEAALAALDQAIRRQTAPRRTQFLSSQAPDRDAAGQPVMLRKTAS